MNVVRKMVILTNPKDVESKGVLKLDKIGSKVSGSLNLYGRALGGTLYIRNGKNYFDAVNFDGPRTTFDAYAAELAEDIECVIFDGRNAVMRGTTGGQGVGSAQMLAAYAPKPEPEHVKPDIGTAYESKPEPQPVAKSPAPRKKAEPVATKKTTSEKKLSFENIKPVAGEFAYSAEAPFYEAVREQLDELFKTHPAEENLKSLIAESEWAHIKYDGEQYYVVGVIKESGKPKLICYGVPADKKTLPETDVTENCEFLCVNRKTPDAGYYMMYQDATTGETVKS